MVGSTTPMTKESLQPGLPGKASTRLEGPRLPAGAGREARLCDKIQVRDVWLRGQGARLCLSA